MRLVYADSSVLFAWFHPRDEFSLVINEIEEFWTCDAAQAGLAKAADLNTRLFAPKRPSRG